ncbi:MAG: hypothetical protein EHM35_00850 [Planctomycetaceae bacterium]|nr:MAG: hypothetical protein EHM35_00850 [Planctomycetaceae bacterium]
MDLSIRIREVWGDPRPVMSWAYGQLMFGCPVPNDLTDLLIKAAEAYLCLGRPDCPFIGPSVTTWKDWQIAPRVTVELEGIVLRDRTDWYVVICEYAGQGHSLPRQAKAPITGKVGHWYDVLFACGACAQRFNQAFGTDYGLRDLSVQLRRAYDCIRKSAGRI